VPLDRIELGRRKWEFQVEQLPRKRPTMVSNYGQSLKLEGITVGPQTRAAYDRAIQTENSPNKTAQKPTQDSHTWKRRYLEAMGR